MIPRNKHQLVWTVIRIEDYFEEDANISCAIKKHNTDNSINNKNKLNENFKSYLHYESNEIENKNTTLVLYDYSFLENFSKIWTILRRNQSFLGLKNLFVKFTVGFIAKPIEAILLKKILKKHEKNELPNDKSIIYFPLHFQPESTSIPSSNDLYDQLLIIDQVSKSMADNQLLVVKEHPASYKVKSLDQPELRYPHRSLSFYKKISSYKNVILIRNSYNSIDLIDRSDLIVTIKGSVTLESLARRKNVLLFGSSFYSSFPNVENIRTSKQLNQVLHSQIKKKIFIEEYYSTLLALQDYSLEYYEPIFSDTVSLEINRILKSV
jgi:hypothetical protein